MFDKIFKEKKEDIWLNSMTKAPTPTEKSKKKPDNTKKPPKLRLYKDCGPTQDGQLAEQDKSSDIEQQPPFGNRNTLPQMREGVKTNGNIVK